MFPYVLYNLTSQVKSQFTENLLTVEKKKEKKDLIIATSNK